MEDIKENKSNKSKPLLTIRDRLRLLPKDPGCYLFKDKYGKVIYVGKAKVLRNRVRSYFSGKSDGRYQFDKLVAKIHDFETIVTINEMEALVLEAGMIRKYRPRFNIDVRDDRSYPYLKVTTELFPRIFLTREPRGKNAKYYGPLTDVMRIKDTVFALRRACKVRTCNLRITEESIRRKKHKVCLEYHIGNCEGPCEGLVAPDNYGKEVHRLIDTLHGNSSQLRVLLEERMKKYATNKKYEEAARVRDQLYALQSLIQRQEKLAADIQDRDVFGLAQEDQYGCVAVMRIRNGKLVGRDHSFLSRMRGYSSKEVWTNFIAGYYEPELRHIPSQVLLPEKLDAEDKNLLLEFLSEKRGKKVNIRVPQRGDLVRIVELAKHNAELLLGEHLQAKAKQERIPHSLITLKEHLNLPDLPRIIECFDNSNLFGTHPVAAMVRFKNARPEKREYRHFRIKNVEGIDDFASMREVVERRYTRLLGEEAELPDLVLIDGGIGQVNAARKILDGLGLEYVTTVGLAKRLEEIVFPRVSKNDSKAVTGNVITLPKTSSALKLLMYIRDEAHRFAITYHRKLRAKASISTTLTTIPGIGESKAKALIRHFGSLKRLKEANPADISEVPGFSEQGGKELLERLLNG